MIIAVPKETYPGERRVALVPLVVPTLVKAGFEVVIEATAGLQAGYPDSVYQEKGAKVLRKSVHGFGDDETLAVSSPGEGRLRSASQQRKAREHEASSP